jgi:hypothetical protein
MLRPTKKMWARIGAATILGAAFASAAIAAETSGAADASVSTSTASSVVSSVSLPAAASQVAAQVLDAIAGGSNPSAVASRRSDDAPAGLAKAGSAVSGLISAAQQMIGAGTAGTAGVRPGWGCGDNNHTHSGPPGRPDATPPPGCAK